MFSPFLRSVLTKSGHAEDGCGMSDRPEYYSGRGATTSDLDPNKLQKIWTAILAHRGAKEAEAFVRMVESIPVLSATDFLLALCALERNNFKWDHDMLPKGKGIHATDHGSAFGTVMSVMSGSMKSDSTREIKFPFLNKHGRKIKMSPYEQHLADRRW